MAAVAGISAHAPPAADASAAPAAGAPKRTAAASGAAPAPREKRARTETTEDANRRLRQQRAEDIRERTECPFLSTINRAKLNFDNERKCGQTLQTRNIYMCLVCGHYFAGRGKGTPAHSHALAAEHYMWMDLSTGQIWCIPEMYEVRDDSLSDIQHNLHPSYAGGEVEKLLGNPVTGHRQIEQTEFTVGYVGLNNLKLTDNMNAVLQAILHIPPLVKHYLQNFRYRKEVHRSPLRDAVSELFRKVWNPHNYIGQVSPRSLIEVCDQMTGGKFGIDTWEEPQVFLTFLLNHLNAGERRAQKDRSQRTIIEDVFQGRMRITNKEYRIRDGSDMNQAANRVEVSAWEEERAFFTLPVGLPSTPLSRDEGSRNVVELEHLLVLLQRYNGVAEHLKSVGHNRAHGRRFTITRLPRYLVLYFERFQREFGVLQKNRAIVNSPVVSLEMCDFCTPEEAARYSSTKYDLLATVLHDGVIRDGRGGVFKCYQYNKQAQHWLEMEDLRVVRTEPQVVSVAEAYIQIWQRRGAALGSCRAFYEEDPYRVICSYLPQREAARLPLLCSTLRDKVADWTEEAADADPAPPLADLGAGAAAGDDTLDQLDELSD